MREVEAEAEKVLSILGMARRAGVLIIGQDNVKSSLSHRDKLFILFPEDAPNGSEKTFKSLSKKAEHAVLDGISTERLSHAIGVNRAVVVALPERSGFVSGIKSSTEGGVVIEQSESI